MKYCSVFKKWDGSICSNSFKWKGCIVQEFLCSSHLEVEFRRLGVWLLPWLASTSPNALQRLCHLTVSSSKKMSLNNWFINLCQSYRFEILPYCCSNFSFSWLLVRLSIFFCFLVFSSIKYLLFRSFVTIFLLSLSYKLESSLYAGIFPQFYF